MVDHDQPTTKQIFELLTKREHEILRLKVEGYTNQEIADHFFIALSTVKWYVRQVYNKLGINNRSEAIILTRETGLFAESAQTTAAIQHNLPAQTTPFVGREAELDNLTHLLADPKIRLVTILAAGGMGKTRLALEAAEQQLANYPDGVFFVPLVALASPDLIIHAIAEHTGYAFQPDSRTLRQQLLDFLNPKRLLLVLDNFEHLLDGAPLVTDILQAAPHVTILITSRERLRLHGETVYDVGGMKLPDHDEGVRVRDSEVVQLFARAACRANPDFALNADNITTIVQLCRLAEGMPLAIILAAAWIDVLPLGEIADEITRSIDFLAAEMSDAPRRHWSIQAVFEPTWLRLTDAQRGVFMKLAVFRGGFSRHGVQTVAGASLFDLQALVNKALLTHDGEGRYSIHELLRQFAEQKLWNSGETDAMRAAHAAYYGQTMQTRLADLKGANQLETLDDVEIDLENLRMGWTWALEHGTYGLVRQYVQSLGLFFWMRNRLQEGVNWFSTAAHLLSDQTCSPAHAVYGNVLAWYSLFLSYVWDFDRAVPMAQQALAIALEQPDISLIAFSKYAFCVAEVSVGDIDTNFTTHTANESLELYRQLDDKFWMARVIHMLGYIAYEHNQFDVDLMYARQGLALRREIGDALGIANSLVNLGAGLQELGDWELAEQHTLEGLSVLRDYGHTAIMGIALRNLVAQNFFKGNFEQAAAFIKEGLIFSTRQNLRNHIVAFSFQKSLLYLLCGEYREALRQAEQAHQTGLALSNGDPARFEAEYPLVTLGCTRCALGDFEGVRPLLWVPLARIGQAPAANIALRYCLAGIAAVLIHEGQPERALSILSLIIHHRLSPTWWSDHEPLTRSLLDDLRQTLAPDEYAAAWERGKSLDLDIVVQELCAEA